MSTQNLALTSIMSLLFSTISGTGLSATQGINYVYDRAALKNFLDANAIKYDVRFLP